MNRSICAQFCLSAERGARNAPYCLLEEEHAERDPALKRKTNYQQPPMYVFLHSNQTNNLTFDCFECRARQSLPTAPFTFLMSSAVRPVGLVCHSGQPLAPHLTDGHSHSHTISGSQIHIYKYNYTNTNTPPH